MRNGAPRWTQNNIQYPPLAVQALTTSPSLLPSLAVGFVDKCMMVKGQLELAASGYSLEIAFRHGFVLAATDIACCQHSNRSDESRASAYALTTTMRRSLQRRTR